MALQSSGAISLGQIRNEMVAAGNSSYSLRSLSATAGKGTPDAMSEFYGYASATDVYIEVYEPGGEFWAGCYDGGGGYLGGWYGDHYAWIYNYTTGYATTLTFGGSSGFTSKSGQQVLVTSTFNHISSDTGCGMVYQCYVSKNGVGDVAVTAGFGVGSSGEASYVFTPPINNPSIYLTSWVRRIA
jgi:hypothetical protein